MTFERGREHVPQEAQQWQGYFDRQKAGKVVQEQPKSRSRKEEKERIDFTTMREGLKKLTLELDRLEILKKTITQVQWDKAVKDFPDEELTAVLSQVRAENVKNPTWLEPPGPPPGFAKEIRVLMRALDHEDHPSVQNIFQSEKSGFREKKISQLRQELHRALEGMQGN